jgi:peptidoglycan-N-acetylmuramic acid deacetylase
MLKNVDINNRITIADTTENNWFTKHRIDNTAPDVPKNIEIFKTKYNCYFLGDIKEKTIYLTFDEGYEYGYTSLILDVLKKHNVKAAFFVVKPYITTNPDLIKRMVAEGHLVCNHSARHPSMARILNKEKFVKELSDVEDAYKEITGENMPKFFRPPMGRYSELSLQLTNDYGYKSVFWSFAYQDWLLNNQPTPEFAKKRILSRTHNGAVILLHAVSKTNAEILDEIITSWEIEGYKIKPLSDLPSYTKN